MSRPAPPLRLVGRTGLSRAPATWHLCLPMPELLLGAALAALLTFA